MKHASHGCRGFARKALLILLPAALALVSRTGMPIAQTIGIFGDAVPQNPAAADPAPVTLGLKFWSAQPGAISGIRFFRGVFSPPGYVARLFAADGTLLGSASLQQASGPVPGWQEAYFAEPIPISANKTYVAAYYTPSGQYADGYYGLTAAAANGPLTAPASATVGGNGVYIYGDGFPQYVWKDSNYFVDVVFASAAPAAYLTLRFDPPNPSISGDTPLGSVVATITASWSDGTPFSGTLSFAQPYSNDNGTFAIVGNALIINPLGPGVSAGGNSTRMVTITATQ